MITPAKLKKITPLLGTISDQAVADKFKVSRDSIYVLRRELKIEACRKRIDWTAIDGQFKTYSDAQIAAEHDLKVSAVRERRRYLAKAKPVKKATIWTPANIALLETMGDAELGEKLGVTRMTVWRKRKELRGD